MAEVSNSDIKDHVTAKVGEVKHHVTSGLKRLEDKYEAIEGETDKALKWWERTSFSAAIGVVLLIIVMVIGDVLGAASLFY